MHKELTQGMRDNMTKRAEIVDKQMTKILKELNMACKKKKGKRK